MENIISVIVVTYNQEKTIARTLDSILMQQCHLPIEIVIGEDCSTDDTYKICKDYQSKHPDLIHLISNKQNKGVQDNYFDCMLAAKGKYIADCAGDDFWTDPLKLEKEVCLLEQYPEVNLVHTNWNYYNENDGSTTSSGQQPFPSPITHGHDMLQTILTQTNRPVVHLCTSLYRKDIILQALKDDEQLFRNPDFGCEDLQVAFIEALHGDIAYLPEVTLSYSQGHETISTPADEHKQFRFKQKTTQLCYYLAEKHHINIKSFLQLRVFTLGMHAFRLHSRELHQETLAREKTWKVERDFRNRLLFFILNHDSLWKLLLIIRNIYVSLQ